MNEIDTLKYLLDPSGPAVPLNVLARLCHCTGVTIQNYIHGRSIPTGTKMMGIKEGLRKYKEMINNIIQE